MPVRQTSYPMAGARRERRLNKARGPTLVKVEAPTSSENEDLVRTAFDAFSKGDQNTVLELVDLDLEWTYLDPSMEDPQPQIRRGRAQLGHWMGRGFAWSRQAKLEELVVYGDNVVVVTHTPGTDARRVLKTDDRNFHVVTVRNGRITKLHACRDRQEALRVATEP